MNTTNSSKQQPKWRVEFSACGWASRWYVVRGYYDRAEYLRGKSGFIADFTTEDSANQAASAANA